MFKINCQHNKNKSSILADAAIFNDGRFGSDSSYTFFNHISCSSSYNSLSQCSKHLLPNCADDCSLYKQYGIRCFSKIM